MVVGLFHYGGPDYTDILQRAVVIIGGSLLDTFHDLQSLHDLAKDRIRAVEVGCAAKRLIDLADLRREFHCPLRHLVYALLQFVERRIVPLASPDNIKTVWPKSGAPD